MAEKYLTTDEVCETLKVSMRTLYRYLEGGKLKASKVGKRWLITEADLKAFIESGTN